MKTERVKIQEENEKYRKDLRENILGIRKGKRGIGSLEVVRIRSERKEGQEVQMEGIIGRE